jgi:hypothetical protein
VDSSEGKMLNAAVRVRGNQRIKREGRVNVVLFTLVGKISSSEMAKVKTCTSRYNRMQL